MQSKLNKDFIITIIITIIIIQRTYQCGSGLIRTHQLMSPEGSKH